MKVSAASTMPTSTAKVRSVTTVSVSVSNHTAMSAALSFRISGISSQSPMLYATIIKMAAKADNGTFFHQRRTKQNDPQQTKRVDDSCDRRLCPGAHVGGGACDCSRGGESSEQR